MGKVIILRGISCSGKTTLARQLRSVHEGAVHIFSADDYFLDDSGHYNFRASQLSEAHSLCLYRFLNAVRSSDPTDLIIVDNTNLQVFEVAPYYAGAEALNRDAEVEILEIRTPLQECLNRSRTRVASEPGKLLEERTILDQHRKLVTEPLPSFWVRHVTFG